MKKEELIQETARILKKRGEAYGNAFNVHQDIADMWTIILGYPVSPAHVAMMMIALKIVRNSNRVADDNWIDIAGYAAIGAEIVDDNIVNIENHLKD